MIAAKAFDPVMGIDIHIIQPPGPVPPVPIPHPFIGMLVDPMDFAPVIGATVMVNGMPRATAGTGGKCIPPHIPIGGVFVKPPASECEIFMGSSTVLADGDPLSFLGMPCLSCHDVGMPPPPRLKKKRKTKSLTLPTSVVLAIPAGAPVLVGGPPTVSMMALGMKAAMAGLGKAFKKLKKTKLFKKAAKKFKKAKQKAFKNMKPGFIKCNVLKAEPVNVITGEVVIEHLDFLLPWRIPLDWTRHYRSGSTRPGVCGRGWETPADSRLEIDDDGIVTFFDGSPGGAVFPYLPVVEPVLELVDGGTLSVNLHGYEVRTKQGLTYHFHRSTNHEVLAHRVSDACGNWIEFVRNGKELLQIRESSGASIHVVSEAGRVRRMLLQQSDKKLPLTSYEYNDNDLVVAYDAVGEPYRFYYDAHQLLRHTDRVGLSFYYEFDQVGPHAKCTHAWGDGGLYDYRFRYLNNTTHYTDSLRNDWSSEHVDGLISREIDPTGGVTSYEYDEMGRTAAVTNPAGLTKGYVYDDRGNLIVLDEYGLTQHAAEYDEFNRCVKRVTPNGGVWEYEWDERGLLRRSTSPRGGVWLFEYGRHGDLITLTDPISRTATYTYDQHGALVEERIGDNVVTMDRDLLGNVVRRVDGARASTVYERDAKGRVTSVTDPTGQRIGMSYDAEDNLVVFRDEMEHTTHFRYAGLGEITERIWPDGSVDRYRYDTEERLIAVESAGRVYALERDALGRVVQEIDYWGKKRRYEYDPAGWLEVAIDPLGRRVRYQRDARGNVTAKELHDGSQERFQYDPAGNLLVAANSTITVTRAYDSEDQLVEERQGEFIVRSDMDLAGNRIRRETSYAHEAVFSYDDHGDTREIWADGARLSKADFDGQGNIIQEQLARSLVRTFRRDAAGALLEQTLSAGNATVQKRSFSYDPRGDLLERISADGRYDQFAYDAAGRQQRPPVPAWLLGGGVRYDDAARYHLDDCGNVVVRPGITGSQKLEWDAGNRLTAIYNADSTVVRMEYDALGRRVTKTSGEQAVRFYWDDETLAVEHPTGGPSREFIYRPGSFTPFASIGEETQFFETDNIGLPHEVVRSDGALLWQGTFDTWGRLVEEDRSQFSNPFRFPGQYHDYETGLSFNRYRYYDPSSLRFISQDPIGLAGGLDLYAYAPSVWNWTDPLGLNCGKKRGPKVWPHGAHNKKIQSRIDGLKKSLKKKDGWEHTHGGSLTEEFIPTPGGVKAARRPDITFTNKKTGEVYRENVGRTRKRPDPVTGRHEPVPREVSALDDIESATGDRPAFSAYDR